jgi:subtilisin family serine protease
MNARFLAAIVFCMMSLSALSPSSARIIDSSDPALILFKRGALDTRARRDLDTSSEDRLALLADRLGDAELRVIQFVGPVRRHWIERIKQTGSEIIAYVPNNAYIIRGGPKQLAEVALLAAGELADDLHPVRWMGRLLPIQKIDPQFGDEDLSRGDAADVRIELIDSADSAGAIERISRLVLRINAAPRRFLRYVVLSVRLPLDRLLEVASFDQVLFIEPDRQPELHDERACQILAGKIEQARPIGPGYLNWLAEKGLDVTPDFVIDVTDGGLDLGSTEAAMLHPDFLDEAGRSRVAYNINYTSDGPEDRRGHGTLVASVLCGQRNGGLTDPDSYLIGLGAVPNARIGMSRIFDSNGKLPFAHSFTEFASRAYENGARISNNSWGQGGNSYDSIAQEYDALVRDAQPRKSDNQEMTFIFSAGNRGAWGGISSPGTAKNVITVAASENYRPEGSDSCNFDGMGGIGPDGADSALDIARFSSSGPTRDGRAKPDLAAPGTHIYGAASRSPFFHADGLCPGTPIYQPPGQRLYTWSSGTSLAAPNVTGAAALVRHFFVLRDLEGQRRPPSPAMIKAYLINSATYMTGQNAGGDLPGARQGWGLVNLSRAFDDTSRALIDQTVLFTESGQTFEISGSLADRSRPLRVTLVWTDAPGSLLGAPLVNDLDLEITIGAVKYYGNNFEGQFSVPGRSADRHNNVESIYIRPEDIPEGFEGNFTITVRAANIAGDGVPGNDTDLDQDFALVIYNIAPPLPPPPEISSVSYVGKLLTITGRNFTAAALVEINGRIIEREFKFDPNANSLSIRAKRRKLNLFEGENQIVVIEGGRRSSPFLLHL